LTESKFLSTNFTIKALTTNIPVGMGDCMHIQSEPGRLLHRFEKLHKNIQMALFDMIFNLGATKIVNSFPGFNKALKAGDWKKAATESNRPDFNTARNQYVKQFLNAVPAVAKPTISTP
jgi:hypothetical protein